VTDTLLPLRRRLVSVATGLFAAQGYEATSVQQIVQAAGVTKGGFYHHFASKDELLFEVYHRVLAEQTSRLEEIASGPGDPAQRLAAVVADVIATSVENLDELTVYLHSAHALPADQRAAMRAERRRYHLRVRRLIEEGQRSGVFTSDVPADVAVHFVYGAINQLATWYRRGGKLSAADLAAHFDRLLLTGLRN
jgi:AcrR family transcriptional regulator